MRILLDTHIFLWFLTADARLDVATRDAIVDTGNDVWLSVVSLWEAIIKHRLGKLPLPSPPEILIPAARARHGIKSLPVDESSVLQLPTLPAHHRDPFDRIIICQAIAHGLVIATDDPEIQRYSVPIFSADP